MTPQLFKRRWLKVGEQVRLTPGGKLHEVEAVTICSASLRVIETEPILVEIPGREPFIARKGRRIPPISPTAFVYRDSDARDEEKREILRHELGEAIAETEGP